jgi:hypothetical protein
MRTDRYIGAVQAFWVQLNTPGDFPGVLAMAGYQLGEPLEYLAGHALRHWFDAHFGFLA